jgi:hypothetical protein
VQEKSYIMQDSREGRQGNTRSLHANYELGWWEQPIKRRRSTIAVREPRTKPTIQHFQMAPFRVVGLQMHAVKLPRETNGRQLPELACLSSQ